MTKEELLADVGPLSNMPVEDVVMQFAKLLDRYQESCLMAGQYALAGRLAQGRVEGAKINKTQEKMMRMVTVLAALRRDKEES